MVRPRLLGGCVVGGILALSALGGRVSAQDLSAENLARRAVERRAVEAAIWEARHR